MATTTWAALMSNLMSGVRDFMDNPPADRAEPKPKQPSRWDLRADGRNVAHQHIPGFVTGSDPEDIPFSTLEELLDVPFIARWKTDRFSRYSLSDKHLMAEMKDGGFWVLATLDWPIDGLPMWDNSMARRYQRDKAKKRQADVGDA